MTGNQGRGFFDRRLFAGESEADSIARLVGVAGRPASISDGVVVDVRRDYERERSSYDSEAVAAERNDGRPSEVQA